MLYRSLVLGLLGAIALLIATRPSDVRSMDDAVEPAPAVVHVSRRALEASPLPIDATLTAAIGLRMNERIADVRLEVTDGVSTRRVVVIVEP